MMTPEEYRRTFVRDLRKFNDSTDRAASKAAGNIGASDFDCRERMRFIMERHPETDETQNWAAFVGSALDEGVMQARALGSPHLLFKMSLPVTLSTRQGPYTFYLTPDEIDLDEPSVTDWKSKNGLQAVRRKLVEDPNRRQRHLQALAVLQAGMAEEKDLIVRNIMVDRSGADPVPHVEQEAFSREVIAEAETFLSDVMYARENDERASQDRPRNFCERYCPFVTACRGDEINYVPIFDPYQVAMIEAFYEAKTLEDEAAQLRDELKPFLVGLTGVTESGYRIKTTNVNKRTGSYQFVTVTKDG
jgi:hypothetical protein